MNDFSEIEKLASSRTSILSAIKLYREQTGKSLKESKTAVEFFLQHGHWKEAPVANAEARTPRSIGENRVDRERIEAFIQSGKIINAIKLYREGTGASLAESKAAVDRYRSTGYWE